jgi:methylenetetrahydrofolate reductase (NADPH)
MGDAFHIEVAAYPEFHPQSGSVQSDIKALLEKERAGADCAITQYFFNQDAYFRYCDDARAMGVSLPIVPGIMPILNASQLIRFSEACGAEIPRWIKHRLQSFGDDVNSIKAFGVDVITRLCEQMIQGGAPGLHFYSMNQSAAVMQICQNLKLA